VATGAVIPYEVVRPKSIFADIAPAIVVDHMTMPTVPILVLIDDDCVTQFAELPPEPVVPATALPAEPVVPPRPALPVVPPRPALPVVPAVEIAPPEPVVPADPVVPATPVVPASPLPATPVVPALPLVPAPPLVPAVALLPAEPVDGVSGLGKQPVAPMHIVSARQQDTATAVETRRMGAFSFY
jgi:hypothetical protein